VGGHITRYIQSNHPDWNIHGISRSHPVWDFLPGQISGSIEFHQGDLLDAVRTRHLVKEIDPDFILHLAAFSSVGESWQKPVEAFLNNTNAFLNVVEAVRLNNPACRIVSVGSSEEYGIVDPGQLPIREDARTRPANPYAVARVSQENLAQIYMQGYHVDICSTRSFNHIGPGQRIQFVVSSIADQFAKITVNGSQNSPVISIGNGNIVRDFIDIDDVIQAYDSIFTQGKSGETYNVCSGKGHSIADIVRIFSEMLDIPVSIRQQSTLVRPIDNPILVGSYEKLHSHTGWEPRVPIEESLRKIYSYWFDRESANI